MRVVRAAALLLASSLTASGQTITTVAGTGEHASAPDGAVAATSPLLLALDNVSNVAFDPEGNLTFSEGAASRVRRIDRKTGRLETVAGAGARGFSGDGGPATHARLRAPAEIAFDKAGNLFIADAENCVIRRVDVKTKVITTVAGVPGVSRWDPEGRVTLTRPAGLTFDRDGTLVVADTLASFLRRLDLKTNRWQTLAGNGDLVFLGPGPARARGFAWPNAPRFDKSGRLFFCATGTNRILALDTKAGLLSIAAGNGAADEEGDGGPGPEAKLNQPASLAIDRAGNVFIADSQNNAIRRLDAKTGILTHVAGDGRGSFAGDGGPAAHASLWNPTGLGFDADGNLYVVDATNGRIRRIALVGAR